MKVVLKAAVLGLAGLAAFGVTGCNRGGGSGSTTTIIQQAPPMGATSSSSSTTPSVTPINDGKRLCSLLKARGQEVVKAIDGFWDLAVQSNKSWSDSDVSAAADNAKAVVDKIVPIIQASVGGGAPTDIADAARNFVTSAKEFAETINNRGDKEDLDRDNKKFSAAVDGVSSVCQ